MIRFLKITSAAAYMDVSTRTVRRMINEGILHPVKFPHEIRRIDREEIEALGRKEEKISTGIPTQDEIRRFVKGAKP